MAPRAVNAGATATGIEAPMTQEEYPLGYCQCGCGARTPEYKHHQPHRGMVLGQPARYLTGHHRRRTDHYRVEDCGYDTPCWVWQLSCNAKGYGRIRVPGEDRKMLAHRLYYERALGPIPDGLEIDHLCRVPACVNPDHLEPVTPLENQRRGWDARKAGAFVQGTDRRDRRLGAVPDGSEARDA